MGIINDRRIKAWSGWLDIAEQYDQEARMWSETGYNALVGLEGTQKDAHPAVKEMLRCVWAAAWAKNKAKAIKAKIR